MDKTTGSLNPFTQGDPGHLAQLIVDLMPTGEPVDAATRAAREKAHHEAHTRWHEARYGALEPDTYRLLEQGSLMGWYYELEVAGTTVTLKPEQGTEFGVGPSQAVTLARQQVAARLGQEKAARAQFKKVWGGTL